MLALPSMIQTSYGCNLFGMKSEISGESLNGLIAGGIAGAAPNELRSAKTERHQMNRPLNLSGHRFA
jgi:hypothetical protein